MQNTDGRGGLRSGIGYRFFFFFFFFFFRYVASGMTSEARWRFGANRLSSKGGSDNL